MHQHKAALMAAKSSAAAHRRLAGLARGGQRLHQQGLGAVVHPVVHLLLRHRVPGPNWVSVSLVASWEFSGRSRSECRQVEHDQIERSLGCGGWLNGGVIIHDGGG